MTPKEKALYLCQKFGYLGIKWEQTEYTTFSLENAKQCALIAVDEIMNALEKNGDWNYDYWQEVKQEIEKL